ncbi:LysE/ArgO family amino acid transporter [Alicyclobacillus mengziensis]|uniref:LysE family transporter n=1 Tax=Alicyclobacillus mengziensis TaxID=2931921 RepID=A0A9X7VV95_9BACL|nr:LysE family transporter [Alicyclobacillus mengziensis]QSO45819.1 LysE family transporter [Alicyclobacillus mengziensis]
MLLAFIHGFLLSLGLILPIGMQNGFILTQGALHSRWSNSLPAVLTASMCDTFLIALAVIGVSTVALHITWLRYTFGGIGIAFLIYMGFGTWREKQGTNDQTTTATAWTTRRQIGFTSSVSLLNPHALIDTLAVIGGSAVVYTAWSERIAFGAASVLVSWLWFFALSITGHVLGKVALQKSSLQVLNKVSAVMMWMSAAYLGYIIYSFQ